MNVTRDAANGDEKMEKMMGYKSAEPKRMKFLTFHYGKNTVGVGMVYELTNDFDPITYTCENKPLNYITPCKVTTNHQPFDKMHDKHSNYSWRIASIYADVLCYGKGRK